MERLQNNEALLKWGALGAAVVALECVGDKSLTQHAREALEHPVGRVVVPILGAVTLLHLLDRCPPQVDFYYGIGKVVDYARNRA